MNRPPEYCPYCGSPVDGVETSFAGGHVETPMVYRCDSCEDYVFYNPTPGGSAAVVDGDRMLLVKDFRSPGEWKLPSGRIELGESVREGVARELEEETGLSVDPTDLAYFYDEAGEPVDEQYMVKVDFAVPRSETTGRLRAGSDATDARFFTAAEFEASDHTMKATHVDRFGTASVEWLLARARVALDEQSPPQ